MKDTDTRITLTHINTPAGLCTHTNTVHSHIIPLGSTHWYLMIQVSAARGWQEQICISLIWKEIKDGGNVFVCTLVSDDSDGILLPQKTWIF